MNERQAVHADVEQCVEATLSRVGRRICLGTPLGLGKANHIVNEFFRRAQADPRIDLRIFTALTLSKPVGRSELERRFIEPLAERLFGGYPEIAYVEPMRRGQLPANIRVSEFYFQPAAFLNNPLAQQQYVSSNYSHVVRDLMDAGINVLAQLVAPSMEDGKTSYSLSCNPDLTLDLVPRMREAERRGTNVAILAQVNRRLPFMYGDAVVGPDYFDAIVDAPKYEFPLFAPPNTAVSTADYLIALHVSALIRDGGTLQLGIGSLGDAVSYLLKLRHEQNDLYRDILSAARVSGRFPQLIEHVGGTGTFVDGLYAATEMFVDSFLDLYRAGVLKRKVHDNIDVQRRLNEGSSDTAHEPGGFVAHACFFLGPQRFYDALNAMSRSEREQICMTSISFVNQLYGDEELKRLQRVHARFVNTGLVVTLTGAVASDALEDGRVLSGVGGQYNFVAMAQELEDGRSILLIRSTREEAGTVQSNIRARYGSVTIPRHLRDIVVTEYGIADLRGRTDQEVAIALINIADSRFQEELLDTAMRTGQVAEGYSIPDEFRNNRPEVINGAMAPFCAQGLMPPFPFGTDLTPEELVLARALKKLKQTVETRRPAMPQVRHIRDVITVPPPARPYLERMGLNDPHSLKERLLQRAVVYALAAVDAI